MKDKVKLDLYIKYVALQREKGLTFMKYDDWCIYCYAPMGGRLQFDYRKYSNIMKE